MTIDMTDFTDAITTVAVAEPEMPSLFALAMGGPLARLRRREGFPQGRRFDHLASAGKPRLRSRKGIGADLLSD